MGSMFVPGMGNVAVNTGSHPGGACIIVGKTNRERLNNPAVHTTDRVPEEMIQNNSKM